jgi:hypothetical protein
MGATIEFLQLAPPHSDPENGPLREVSTLSHLALALALWTMATVHYDFVTRVPWAVVRRVALVRVRVRGTHGHTCGYATAHNSTRTQ